VNYQNTSNKQLIDRGASIVISLSDLQKTSHQGWVFVIMLKVLFLLVSIVYITSGWIKSWQLRSWKTMWCYRIMSGTLKRKKSPTCCPTTEEKLSNLSRLGKCGPDGSRAMQQNGSPCSPRGVETKHAASPNSVETVKTKPVTAGGIS
jgi:hypothetical protein